jgi:hypothetical protein
VIERFGVALETVLAVVATLTLLAPLLLRTMLPLLAPADAFAAKRK